MRRKKWVHWVMVLILLGNGSTFGFEIPSAATPHLNGATEPSSVEPSTDSTDVPELICFDVGYVIYLPLIFRAGSGSTTTAQVMQPSDGIAQRRCIVPDVMGLSEATARAAVAAELVVGAGVYQTDETAPPGTVIGQTPAPGTEVDAGSTVQLVVSQGPALITVPDLSGLSAGDAATTIEGAGLAPGMIHHASSERVPADRVLSQVPSAGSEVLPDTPVDVVLSTGPGNNAPVITSSPLSEATEGQSYTYPVAATDPDDDALTFSLPLAPDGMTVDAGSGSVSWTPTGDQVGRHDVTVRVTDSGGRFDQQTFVVTVSGVNVAPVAHDDAYNVHARTTLTVPVSGVLSNDADANGDPLEVTLVTTPTRGALALAEDGSFIYTPDEPSYGPTEPAIQCTRVGAGAETGPLVIDLDQDGSAEIVYHGHYSGLVAINGEDCSYEFQIPYGTIPEGMDDPFYISTRSTLAAGDIDLDGYPEILAVSAYEEYSELVFYAFEHDGTYKWTSENIALDLHEEFEGHSMVKLALANVTGDEHPEVLAGHNTSWRPAVTVFDHQGQILFAAQDNPGDPAASYNPPNGIAVAADIDLDGDMEILHEDDVFDHEGNRVFTLNRQAREVAVANLDGDPYAEILLHDSERKWWAYEHDGTYKWGPTADYLGSISIGDVDGDGAVELVSPAWDRIKVIEADGSLGWISEHIEEVRYDGVPTIFDLNGDAAPEVIYAADRGVHEDGTLYVLNGTDGTILHSMYLDNEPSDDGRLVDWVPVADVDGDGAAEIVAGSDYEAVVIFEASEGDWQPTRPVWNQLTYHVTNVNADGTIPVQEPPWWVLPGLNGYRINVSPVEEREIEADTFTYAVSDGELSDQATVHLTLLPPGNPPEILTEPPLTATVGFVYEYRFMAYDPDYGDVLSYELGTAPAGMTVDAGGLIRWAPSEADQGLHPVSVVVTDQQGHTNYQQYTLAVRSPVTVPHVLGMTRSAAETAVRDAGLTVGTVVSATHPVSPTGAVFEQSPPGGSVAAATAAVDLALSLGPDPADVDDDGDDFTENEGDCDDDNAAICPGASDPFGDGVDQNCDGGDGVRTLDHIVVEPASATLLVGQRIDTTATGVYTDGTSQNLTRLVTLTSSDADVAAVSSGGTVTGRDAGVATISASLDGLEDTLSLSVHPRAPDDAVAPLALITAPTDGLTVTAPLTVTGSASDANFLKYTLAYAPAGEQAFTTLVEATEPLTDANLGQFDPTLLLNGLYMLRLRVYDRAGNVAKDAVLLQVEGAQKIGNFTLSFTDLDIALSGLSLDVARTYDSRDKRQGDFGIGWQMALKALEIQTSGVLGDGWQSLRQGLSYVLQPNSPRQVTIRLPDGRVETFEMVLSPGSSPIVPLTGARATYVPRSGTRGTLEALDNPYLVIIDGQPGPVQLLDDETFSLYNPRRFRYTATDGTAYVLDTQDGLESVTDPNGNSLTFSQNAISHSSGAFVTFQRDDVGRITAVTDLTGRQQTYTYDANGDLVAHTDRAGNTTRYRYDRQHNLIAIYDPLNRPVQRQEFDDEGRLIAITDPTGRRIVLAHDLDAGAQIVRDRRGNATIYEYDAQGNVVRETTFPTVEGTVQAAVTTRSYDVTNRLISETDPNGVTTTYAYDDNGNLLQTVIDPGGLALTTRYTYDADGHLLTITDPRGFTTHYTYGATGNLLSETHPLGQTTRYTYDDRGQVTTQRDPLGNVRLYQYDDQGNVIEQEWRDAAGVTLRRETYSYDAEGNRISETLYVTKGDVMVPLTTHHTYDSNGRRITTTDALGNIRRVAYDAAGQKTAEIDALGHRTEYSYDAAGRLLRVDYADGTSTQYGYDADNNRTAITDRTGQTTTFIFDALDRVIRTEWPDGAVREALYDAAGHLIAELDERGQRTDYVVDAAGRRTLTRQPAVYDAVRDTTLRPETQYTYDAAGHRTAVVDANGHRTEYGYDALGNLVETRFPDGHTVTTTYDALGNKVSETDARGLTIRYTYDALGRLLDVTLPPPEAGQPAPVSRYRYDEAGNLIAETDANGNTTRYQYDVLHRRTARILPMGQRETFAYDAAGHLITRTGFDGGVTTYDVDAAGRPIHVTYPDETTVDTIYRGNGQPLRVTDHRGETVYTYDARDRLISVTDAMGRTVSYTYDASGNQVSVTGPAGATTYTYDALNRLSEVHDPRGDVTGYAYDAVGNLVTVSHANGTSTTHTYNSRNQLTHLVNRTGSGSVISSYAYTLDANGLRTQVEEADGSRVSYTYDDVHRLLRETRTGTAPYELHYSYDAVGNRLTMTEDGDPLAYSYDANNRLLTAGDKVYRYDAAGNLIGVTTAAGTTGYAYDAEGRLVLAVAPDGAILRYTYDVAGNRTSREGQAGRIEYVLDTQSVSGLPQVLEERDGADGSLLAHYAYGADRLWQARDGAVVTYHYDGLGSVRALSDAAQQVVDTYIYDGYGRRVAFAGETENPFQFAGQAYDAQLGFYYLRARYYNQHTGRFITMDPMAGDPQSPISLHRYLYANDNPVNFIDPTGLFTLVEVQVASNIQSNLRSSYIQNQAKLLFSCIKIGFCKIKPAQQMRDIATIWIMEGLPGGVHLYNFSSRMLADAFKSITSEGIKTAQNILIDASDIKKLIGEKLDILITACLTGKIPWPKSLQKLKTLKETIEAVLSEVEKAQKEEEKNECSTWENISKIAGPFINLIPGF